MNWKLIFQLSLFGLAMSFATVYFIPSSGEAFFWLPIFLISAYLVAKKCVESFFLNGFMVSIVNSLWISAVHVILFDAYIAHHANEAHLYQNPTMPIPPKAAMFILGVVMFGIGSGIVLGLFSFVASKIVKNKSIV
ncbi:hypothetical protein [Mucilaginibacter flavus]|uniref:hypothetical protein n=1 Tax=Mucilaginibacter flavus TaxID=931504 RepID=UPI0025B2B670|nr:hypothetical protein [Mucilaginibacter flavus]MDN3580994.1 hypothetical protein [Mucilaginibacter flavus]